ncbi:MAG: c-type cytochrome [Mariprofundaceae bacterium]
MNQIIIGLGVIMTMAACSQPEQSATLPSESEVQTEAQSTLIETQTNHGQVTDEANVEPVQDKIKVSKLIETEMKTPPTKEEEKQLEKAVTEPITTAKDSKPAGPAPSSSPKAKSKSKQVVSKPAQASKQEKEIIETKTTEMPVAEPSSARVMAGNAQRGATLAKKKCKVCHYLDSARKKIGPALQGIYNRAPSISGVPYATWDDKAMDEWLTKPKAVKPKTKMRFSGLKKKEDRQDIIAYLKTL